MKKRNIILVIGFLLMITLLASCESEAGESAVRLIAHRGGVVLDTVPENSREAIIIAAERGYWGVELDMRMTRDSILVAHHDRNFKRYFNDERSLSEMSWDEISELISESGTKVQKLEDALELCSELGLNVMIDNKVSGLPIHVFEHLTAILKKNQLLDDALMIGSSESTEYFTGKIRLSCTREQLENNMLRDDYNSDNYYLFTNPSDEDADWAHSNNIMIVAVINEWALQKESEADEVSKIVDNIDRNNIGYVQLDSKYDIHFLE